MVGEERRRRRIVLGLGNLLCRDEGLGIHALRLLEARRGAHPEAIGKEPLELLDGGTLGLNLLPLVEEASHLLILDAVDAGQPPGTLVELRRGEIPLLSGVKLSEHQVTFQEVLGLASFRGRLPEHLHLIGAQPLDLSLGTELSPLLASVLLQIAERAEGLLRQWSLEG
jgi:hydrogenase maturation protease